MKMSGKKEAMSGCAIKATSQKDSDGSFAPNNRKRFDKKDFEGC